MELVTMSVPVLLIATTLAYWSGRHRDTGRLFATIRMAFLVAVLVVWQWAWWSTPREAFISPGWREISFAPPTIAILCWIVLDVRRRSLASADETTHTTCP